MSDNEEGPLPEANACPAETVEDKAEGKKKVGIGFKPYPSIENHTQKKVIEYLACTRGKDLWVGTEKVHGANFSFCIDKNGDIRCYKRSGQITEEEDFYNWKEVLNRYKDKVKKAFDYVKEKYSDIEVDHVTLFGELYGGHYPHREVKRVDGEKAVQKGVWYRPDTDFYGFDVCINRETFLQHDELGAVFEHAEIMWSTPVMKGTLNELLKFDVETFITTIPKRLGLPHLDDNLAEGLVLRPLVNGTRSSMLKLKRATFSEVSARGAKAKEMRKERAEKLAQEAKEREDNLPPEIVELREDALRYITENRLRSVISKEGVPKFSALNKIAGLVSKDAMDDFRKERPEVDSKPKEQRKMITAALLHAATKLVESNKAAILDGAF